MPITIVAHVGLRVREDAARLIANDLHSLHITPDDLRQIVCYSCHAAARARLDFLHLEEVQGRSHRRKTVFIPQYRLEELRVVRNDCLCQLLKLVLMSHGLCDRATMLILQSFHR